MIALYPIKPVYTERILSGEKRYELRKRLPKGETKYVLIYATYPVGKVVAYGVVKGFHRDTVKGLWGKVSKEAGIALKDYNEYFKASDEACAIEFDRVYKFKRPFNVREIYESFTVPQSFCYVDKVIFDRLRGRKTVKV
jgi:predicted transcriptional regulator